jgi:ElaA protein
MQIRTKNFSELTTLEYHRLMEIRVAVFVVEQECAYQEIDAIDLEATHLWFADEADNVLAYARIYKEDNTIHFGRVLVAKEWRGQLKLVRKPIYKHFMAHLVFKLFQKNT